ncbi:MAG: ABC transporter ATP-binding protein [Clostridia bacterium]|nr:ABC transporter ATP-binding protein [Clostridia bacterium]
MGKTSPRRFLSMFRRMLKIARPWWGNLAVTVFSLIAASLLNLVTPEAVRRLTAALSAPDTLSVRLLLTYAGILLAAYLTRVVFRFLSLWQAHIAAWNFVARLTKNCYDKLQSLALRYYSDKQTGQIMSRMINDTRQLEILIAHTIPDLASNILVILGVAVMILTINWKLALFTMIPVPIIVWLSRIFVTKVAPLFKINQQVLAELNGHTQDNLSGMKEIQAFGREESESLKFVDYCKEYAFVNIRANFYAAMYHPSVEFMTSIGTVIVMGVGGVFAMRGAMSAADIVGFFMYLSLFYSPLATVARLAEDIHVSAACAERVCELLDTESEIREDPDAVSIPAGSGEVAFEHVTFGYSDDAKVLDDVSFRADPGEMVALVGATGVGKTTVVSLLERFYQPQSGRITLNGYDTRHATLKSLRANLSIVLQDVFLFNGTVYENIAYGVEAPDPEAVYEAARIACADEFIRSMPDGYETKIGERGVRLSGGQKQRLAIARAVLRKTPVLILDEATSAVDNETEVRIQEAIENLRAERQGERKQTLIVIAHRLTTIMKADRILVMKEGRIVESGTHEELLARRGLYYEMTSVNQTRIGG